jgi:hypothetical protein
MAQQHYNFGTGSLFVLSTTALNPIPIGAIQDISVDFMGDVKQLFGQNQFALDVARGKVKIDIKAKTGLVDLNLYNSMFFGQTVTALAETLYAFNEAGSGAIPTTPFQLTVANAANFKTDLGVFFTLTGKRLTQVPSAPTAGQYSVNQATGVYTFAAADTAKTVVFNYNYASSTTGYTLAGQNIQMGALASFMMVLGNTSKSKTQSLTFYNCVSSKLALPFKQDDYEIGEIDFMAQDDGTGRVFSWTATGN